MAQISAPRGTGDILPADALRWQRLEQNVRDAGMRYGFGEIRTPLFEHTELFARGIGADTDVVSKEMYTFLDRGERSMTLRPEGTAGVVRAYMEHRLDKEAQPVKMYYMGPMFRYERPQAGRTRQFHQLGVEIVGSPDPAADVESIDFLVAVLRSVGLKDFTVLLNSIGCPSCRPPYIETLKAFLEPLKDDLCSSCRRRYDTNPLRILDCKRSACMEATEDAPVLTDGLCGECEDHFAAVKQYLDAVGLGYELRPRLVRGLDYYTRTVFEVTSPVLGAQDALGGGGRYDGLVSALGGPPTPAVGFAAGMERILLAAARAAQTTEPSGPEVYIVSVGPEVRAEAVGLAARLRGAGVRADMDYMGRSLRAQLRQANRLGASRALVLGEDEVARGVVTMRDMEGGAETEWALTDVVQVLLRMRGEG